MDKAYCLGLELSVRSSNCLYCGGIDTLKRLLNHTKQDLFKYKNTGTKVVVEIENELKLIGLKLRTETCPFCDSTKTITKYSWRGDAKWRCLECLNYFKGGVK